VRLNTIILKLYFSNVWELERVVPRIKFCPPSNLLPSAYISVSFLLRSKFLDAKEEVFCFVLFCTSRCRSRCNVQKDLLRFCTETFRLNKMLESESFESHSLSLTDFVNNVLVKNRLFR